MHIREVSWDEVVTAGTVIFGPSFATFAGGGTWRGELKTAYRRRVLETHPDRAALLGRSEAELGREFQAVAEAYELLARLRAGPLPVDPAPAAVRPAARTARARRPAPPPARPPPRTSPPTPPSAGPRAAGPRVTTPPQGAGASRAATSGPGCTDWTSRTMPRRRLRLAEFLYYSGRVPWQDFVAAIAWQRRQRPPVGRVAVDFGFLAHGDVSEILERRRREGGIGEPFGEFAVRRGYLTPFQLLAALGQQLRLQRPIGRYFVERGLVSERDLDAARAAAFHHNARH